MLWNPSSDMKHIEKDLRLGEVTKASNLSVYFQKAGARGQGVHCQLSYIAMHVSKKVEKEEERKHKEGRAREMTQRLREPAAL